ncbi:GntR family transcriptional regulator [Ancylobacter sp. 6x-1]|uniref:GntR family transcriptional regulator n=1 Tax=Ancylobacter crimeensis TaxID=2579147 RepID=A0ABT0DC81_9HYPH|nr:GntR family transcriptional regulator [Ancylobacter crimeensis]MCK0197549.1 GntR family transcriptional regulator [Ancylobacter crimeensis]
MKLNTTNIAQMASASDVIFEALREAISRGDIKEGEVLRQENIARLFNVSRIPVREALTRLEEQGLVATQRYRGAVVTTLSIAEIREIFEFRALLEPEMLRHSIPRLSEEALDKAREAAHAFATEPDSAQWGELNRRLHYSLYEEAGRPFYLQSISAALDRVDRYSRAQLVLTSGMQKAVEEHRLIIEACAARDVEMAVRLTHDHIMGACESLIAFLGRTRSKASEQG